jgi:EAL domain-containing protein (putative c-di-GMP-specific phosphodiesterase class I)
MAASQHRSLGLPRLLVVEDDRALRAALTRSLRHRFDVTPLPDAASAAAQLQERRFDVVLSDVLLEGMTGIDLLRTVRAYDLDVPVILMTGLPEIDGAIEAMDLGAVTYIRKPFAPAVLDAALDRALKRSALARARRDAVDARLGGFPVSIERTALTARLDRALESLWIAFQPVVDGRSRRTIGFEAFMRSREPTMPSPAPVLDAAEKLGRLREVGRCVRARAARAFESAPRDALLFVNVHPTDLLDEDLFDARAPLGVFADRVVLEIPERASIADINDVRHRADELRRRGFTLALDELSAGPAEHTSFAAFEPEIVKLDMSLVRGGGASEANRHLVARIVSVCRDLQMRVAAKGIESVEELSYIRDLGCQYLQGHLLGRPSETPTPSEHTWP